LNKDEQPARAEDGLRRTTFPLNHGSGAIPAVGFGTLIPGSLATKEATRTALQIGFRHFDCAERYLNEEAVGEALEDVIGAGKVRREEVFVTTKLWNTNHRPDRVKPAFDGSRQRLRTDYIDSYLVHTPFAFLPGDEQDPRDEHGSVVYDDGVTLLDTWRATESLVDEGACRSIGLADVSLDKLKDVAALEEIRGITTRVRFNSVVDTGVPGFIPRSSPVRSA
jgi:diketogulonate reductase-like aldo/keto reductase